MFLDEIAAYLQAQAVGTVSANIFKGSRANIPDTDGPFLSLIETGGVGPRRIHNEAGAHTQRPTAQVCVRGKNYIDTRTMAKAAYVALDGVFNATLSGVFYQSLIARQEPQDIGLDERKRVLIVFNIEAEKQPS